MNFVYDDGGRQAAGFKGKTGDCGIRAIAIATGRPYRQVYDEMNVLAKKRERVKKRSSVLKGRSNSRTGIYNRLFKIYMANIGWEYVSTSGYGEKPWRVHANEDDFPRGRIILNKRKHYMACVEGVEGHREIRDTWDSSAVYRYEQVGDVLIRTGDLLAEGSSVYGYWSK